MRVDSQQRSKIFCTVNDIEEAVTVTMIKSRYSQI